MHDLREFCLAHHTILREVDDATLIWVPSSVSYLEISKSVLTFVGELFSDPNSLQYVNDDDFLIFSPLIELKLLVPRSSLLLTLPTEGLQPIGYRIVVTEACNFTCPGCFSTTALKARGQVLRSMTEDAMKGIVEEIIKYNDSSTPPFFIHFFGGEPLLRLKIIKCGVELLEKAFLENKISKPTFGITTNGSVISEEIKLFLKEHQFRVGVSVEITQDFHNTIRKNNLGESTFDLVKANFKQFKDYGVNPYILVTPYKECQDDLPKNLATLIDELGLQRVTINTPFDKDSLGWDVNDNYAQLLIECERVCVEKGVEADSALTAIVTAISEGVRRISPQAIYDNKVIIAVDPKGNFSSSPQIWSPSVLIGPKLTKEVPMLNTTWDQKCFSCDARFVCGGPNREYQIATGLPLDKVKCNFYKSALTVIGDNLELFAV